MERRESGEMMNQDGYASSYLQYKELSSQISPVGWDTRAPPGFIIVSISAQEFHFLRLGEAYREEQNRKKEIINRHGLDLIAIAASTSDSLEDSGQNSVGMDLSPGGGNSLYSSVMGDNSLQSGMQSVQAFGKERAISGNSPSPLTYSLSSTPDLSTPVSTPVSPTPNTPSISRSRASSMEMTRASSMEMMQVIKSTTTVTSSAMDMS